MQLDVFSLPRLGIYEMGPSVYSQDIKRRNYYVLHGDAMLSERLRILNVFGH